MHRRINEVVSALQGYCNGLHQLVVRYGIRTDQLLIQPKISVENLPFNTGQPFLEEQLLGRRFQISPSSFFQVNTRPEQRQLPEGIKYRMGPASQDDFSMAELLALVVANQLDLNGGETLLDAYSGVGTFALLLSERAGRVIGIEEARSAILDSESNRQGTDNVRFVEGKTERVVRSVEERIDAVILDPARAGCEPEVIDALLDRRPHRIVYVSCEPSTLTRDLRRFHEGGYRVVELQPLDMFPQTFHIETVATLEYDPRVFSSTTAIPSDLSLTDS